VGPERGSRRKGKNASKVAATGHPGPASEWPWPTGTLGTSGRCRLALRDSQGQNAWDGTAARCAAGPYRDHLTVPGSHTNLRERDLRGAENRDPCRGAVEDGRRASGGWRILDLRSGRGAARDACKGGNPTGGREVETVMGEVTRAHPAPPLDLHRGQGHEWVMQALLMAHPMVCSRCARSKYQSCYTAPRKRPGRRIRGLLTGRSPRPSFPLEGARTASRCNGRLCR